MKFNKKHWIALAIVGVLLLGLIFAAYRVLHQSNGRAERLDLGSEQNRRLAAELMDKLYGHDAYDGKQHCWANNDSDADYCMKPVQLDRVDSAAGPRLYLLAGADGHTVQTETGGLDLWSALGAAIANGDSHELIASTRMVSFIDDARKAPSDVRLLQLNGKGDMGWLLEGMTSRRGEPLLLAARKDQIENIGGELFGKLPSDAEQRFDYRVEAGSGDGYYPLQLSVGGDKQRYRFVFDDKTGLYQCADDDCRQRWQSWSDAGNDTSAQNDDSGDESGDESAAANQPPADANAALFDDGNKLSDADLKDVLAALGATYVVKDQDTWGFVTEQCRTPFRLSGSYGKTHDEDHNEIWIRGGDSCTSGATGQSIWTFDRDDDGHLRVSLGVPATKVVVVTDGPNSPDDNPRNDIRLSGNGFCESLWRWDGKQYQRLRNEATQPGGCDREPAAQQ
ncbi:hypothetical protein KIF53_00485 [Chromobacterium subtsugae]|uniref:Lipoprotein n=1 Tax=Chromobacterium subtsugae TaxID=251747 RepID=A0ABS7F7P0_9NEIS|nr:MULTISPECIES: hypothetical protein [Chromobacterium]KUM02094.1 hypothetical protein Cv017_04960 [Chromobacterium subtsugae]KZE83179.1 hypothetical protein AWB61_06065 [Chromobacterium sp. F49]MBW7567139.1 hypothetical protein [Chromobacterium subtsugae]MBW8286109.1 hypothetical protein [Chromobacterium subtsugae]WSE91836.1 hypothetical protein U6115_00945 [Chromobacterium subtsugae]